MFLKYSLYSYILSEEDYEAHKEAVLKRYSVDLQDEDDLRYGYAHWYGMNVSDINEDTPDYGLNNFPFGLPFNKVTKNDISGYKVLIYYPKGTGARCFGMLVDDARYEVVCFYSDQIR